MTATVSTLSMPAFVPPCLAQQQVAPPEGDRWLHELKLDGFRMQVLKDGRTVRLLSSDGGLVTHGADGKADFAALLRFGHDTGASLVYWAFDLLHCNGRDTRPLPLEQRKQQLTEALAGSALPCLMLCESFPDGRAQTFGLEGVVSKCCDAPYASGRRREWVKVKTPSWRERNRERWRLLAVA